MLSWLIAPTGKKMQILTSTTVVLEVDTSSIVKLKSYADVVMTTRLLITE